MSASSIDVLLRLVPDQPDTVLTNLQSQPALASASDRTGYSLLHAASSYSQFDLLRTLVRIYNVDPNLTDSEGETPLFAAETVAAARCLIEELGADATIRNADGVDALENAQENVEDGGEWVGVVEYLTGKATKPATEDIPHVNGATSTNSIGINGHPPPPLPPGVRITGMRAMPEAEQDGEGALPPDPEFRRRIEELAAREDFQTEQGQSELRTLIEDAVGGLRSDPSATQERDVRRRLDS